MILILGLSSATMILFQPISVCRRQFTKHYLVHTPTAMVLSHARPSVMMEARQRGTWNLLPLLGAILSTRQNSHIQTIQVPLRPLHLSYVRNNKTPAIVGASCIIPFSDLYLVCSSPPPAWSCRAPLRISESWKAHDGPVASRRYRCRYQYPAS